MHMAMACRLGGNAFLRKQLRSFCQQSSAVRSALLSLQLNQPPEALHAIADKLEANWYRNPEDLATLSPEHAAALGVPLRVLTELTTKNEKPPAQQTPQLDVGCAGTLHKVDTPQVDTRVPFTQTRVTRIKGSEYAMKPGDAPAALEAELEQFSEWMTTESYGQVEPVLRPATAEVYMRLIRLALGWASERYPERTALGLRGILFPDTSRDSAATTFEFLQFLRTQRSAAYSYQGNVCRALVKAAKFVHRAEVTHSEDQSWKDLGLIRALHAIQKHCAQKAATSGRRSDEEQKWLSWPEYLKVVKLLKAEAYDAEGTRLARARRFQRYLICAILSSVPDRQRTIRELELNRTFMFDHSLGCWVIKHSADDYKTGKAYGERPPLALPASLNGCIKLWLEEHRQLFEPKHQFLFSTTRGQKPTTDTIYSTVTKATYRSVAETWHHLRTLLTRLTGKRTNPHLLRDAIVTHVRDGDATEKQLEALALFMGHSIAVQKSSYDRRTKSQKVAPAVEMIQSLNATVQ